MKILIEMGDSAAYHYRLGWVKAFSSSGHQVYYWNHRQKSAHDIFAEFEPDVFIGTTWNLSRAIRKCVYARPNLKVLLSAPNWGDSNYEIDPEDTVQVASEGEIEGVRQLKELTGKPDYVMTYYHQNWVDKTHNLWQTLGITPVGIPMGADLLIYGLGTARLEFSCDIAFIGNYWKYKGVNLDKYLLKLSHPAQKYSVRIYGANWPNHNCLGEIGGESLHLAKDIFRSAKICPAIYEPLSAKYGYDISERIFKVCSSGGFCISEWIKSLEEDFGLEGIPLFKDEVEYHHLINEYLIDEKKRLNNIQKSVKWVYNNHTYHHRAIEMLKLLDLPYDSVVKSMEKLRDEHLRNL